MKNAISSILNPSKVYELPISRDYVRHWGMVEAVRELIQNALDSDSPFEYEFVENQPVKSCLILTSRHSTLPISSLLLGKTSKAEAADKIGSFGEGYKIALLVLTRLGCDVRVLNGDRCWTPKFITSKSFDAEVLCIEDSQATSKIEGLKFCVYGLSPSDIEQVKQSCLFMQEHVGALHTTSKGAILREQPGKLYVGGLYVCDTELKFGYNVKPEFLRLERDRQTVSSFDLKCLTERMWLETKRFEEIAAMIDEGTPDLEYVHHGAPEVVKEACYQHFRKKNPGAVIVNSKSELDKMIERGMTKVVYANNRSMYDLVSTAPSYKAQVHVPAITPAEVLRKFLTDNRKYMQAASIVEFKKVIGEAEKAWRLK